MDAEKDMKQGFLPVPSEEDVEVEYEDWRYEKTTLRKKYFHRFAIAQLVLLLLYAAVFGLLFRKTSISYAEGHASQELVSGETIMISADQEGGRRGDQFVWTPAESVDEFQKTELNMHLYKKSPYRGPPNEAVDKAWESLFSNAYIRLSGDELARLGRNSTLVQDGSGDYLGALDMYHQLHCVWFLFKYIHSDYYTLKKINVPEPDHLDHCIDVLRQVVMCYADTSISTMKFYDNYYKTWPEFKFQHSCRNWDAIDNWAGQPGRAISQDDPDRLDAWLRNPDFVDTGHYFDGHGED